MGIRASRLIPAFVMAAALAAVPAAAQSLLAEVRDLSPRQTKMGAFTLPTEQDLRIEAIGEEGTSGSNTLTVLRAVWNGTDRRQQPWVGNAWILDLKNRRVVWELSEAQTTGRRAGPREFKGTLHLPAGSYAAYVSAYPTGYATEDDGVGERVRKWFGADHLDRYKLTVFGNGQRLSTTDVDRLRHQASANEVIGFRGTSPEQFQQKGFVLERPTDVEVYAIGEAREDGEFDAGWIINTATREKVWKLTWRDSSPAGGAEKNRAIWQTRKLPAGRYVAFYATDDSHDLSQWNAPPPHDPDFWGLSIRIPDSQARTLVSAIGSYDPRKDPNIIAELTGIRDDDRVEKRFRLERATEIRVYAIGEGSGRDMDDYGWIEDAKTGKAMWEMTYGLTDHGGGASKNRRFDGTITLPAGEYILKYKTDGSHAFGDWNADPPDEPEAWGITLFRKTAR